MSQNFLAMNIVMLVAVTLTFGMMVLWARATRGRWPSRRRIGLTAGFCLLLWLFGNLLYLYFRFH
jgi:hypothetical protein